MIEQSLIDPYLEEIRNLESTWLTAMDNSKTLKQQADEIDRQIVRTQIKAVQTALKGAGQNICSEFNSGFHPFCQNREGLFPTTELQYLFQDRGYYHKNGKVGSLELRHLCSVHYPNNPNSLSAHSYPYILELSSEVIEREGKYLTLIGHIDVSQFPTRRYYTVSIFKRFGIPVRIGLSAYSTIAELNI